MTNADPDAILQAALDLSDEQRIALVTRLVESLQETAAASFDDGEFQHELEPVRRLRRHDSLVASARRIVMAEKLKK